MTLSDDLTLDADRESLVRRRTRPRAELDEVDFAIQEIDEIRRDGKVQTLAGDAADAARTAAAGGARVLKIRKNDRDGWAVLCPMCGVTPGAYGMVTTNVDGDGWLLHYGSQPEALRIALAHARREHSMPEVAR